MSIGGDAPVSPSSTSAFTQGTEEASELTGFEVRLFVGVVLSEVIDAANV